jgi:hypothetical protein
MGQQAQTKKFDTYGHSRDLEVAYGAGFTVATSGTAKATVVYPGTADPAGTANITEPFGVSDSQGLIELTTSGTQTTGALIVINFARTYPYVPPGASVTISKESDASTAGGTITTTVTASSLSVSVGTALTTATKYLLRYVLAG